LRAGTGGAGRGAREGADADTGEAAVSVEAITEL
jgi:hypothetical protein